jgi:hypothetical protein
MVLRLRLRTELKVQLCDPLGSMKQTEENDPSKDTGEGSMSFFEAIGQAFSLIFALQNKSGRKRLLDLAETNPKPFLFAGIVSMVIFFTFCLVSSQILIKLLTD